MFGQWLNKIINGFTNIYRWEGRQRLIKKNDAEHSFGVAIIADGLARLEVEMFHNNVNQLEVVRTALYHDGLEVCMGDIISGIKKETPAMKKAIEEVEYKQYKEKLEPIIVKEWRKDFEKYLLNPKNNNRTIEGRIIAAADNIDAIIECVNEIRMGNSIFKIYLEEISNSLLDINLESSRYFIKNELKDFGIPLEMYGKRVFEFINNN